MGVTELCTTASEDELGDTTEGTTTVKELDGKDTVEVVCVDKTPALGARNVDDSCTFDVIALEDIDDDTGIVADFVIECEAEDIVAVVLVIFVSTDFAVVGRKGFSVGGL